MRRTRILATVGPASSDETTLAALLAAGCDAFRLNFSHGSIEEHQETCRRIRALEAAAGRPVAILQDLAGPKIRIGPLSAAIELSEGETLEIELGDFVGGPGRVSSPAESLFTSVHAGNHLLLDDGRLELEVTGVAPRRLTCRVVSGGPLESHKGINVPGVTLRTPAFTAKDADDLRAGVAMGVDLLAVSFVQSADDIRLVRAAAVSAGAPDLFIIAKIEKPQAVEGVQEILDVADGLMVARGDLGLELPLETLPAVQRRLVAAARQRGVPVIVATQVLESMRLEPRPTRAEVTDAAHAVDERVDAILLTGETAVGRYPVRTVETLDAIVHEAERAIDMATDVGRPFKAGSLAGAEAPASIDREPHGRALCESAVTLAERARAGIIVAVTEAGKTARMLAAIRPAARIFAATPNVQTARRLSVVWGVTPVLIDQPGLPVVREALVSRGLVPAGTVVVFVSMQPTLGRDGANFVHVERV